MQMFNKTSTKRFNDSLKPQRVRLVPAWADGFDARQVSLPRDRLQGGGS